MEGELWVHWRHFRVSPFRFLPVFFRFLCVYSVLVCKCVLDRGILRKSGRIFVSWGWVVRGEWVEKFYYSGEDGFRRLSTSRHNGLESRKMVWYVSETIIRHALCYQLYGAF